MAAKRVFREGADLARMWALEEIAVSIELDGEGLQYAIKANPVNDELRRAHHEVLKVGTVGVPSFVVADVSWREELLNRALARATPEALEPFVELASRS